MNWTVVAVIALTMLGGAAGDGSRERASAQHKLALSAGPKTEVEIDSFVRRDLEAQESMALWAMWMFVAATAGTVLSAAGVFLIWRTLTYTRTAAEHSAEMVEQSRRATEAAIRSAGAAENALTGIERPFLVINPTGRTARSLRYTFSNYGRTPAVILISDVRYLPITPIDGPEPLTANVLQAALTPDWNIVPPNGTSKEEVIQLGQPIVEGAERAQMWVLHGYVMYRALTGESFVSGFGLYKKDSEPWRALSEAAFNYDERLKKGGPRRRQRATLTITASNPSELNS